ncbi:DUF3219 family protein [Paenibacillus sp. Z6-24]
MPHSDSSVLIQLGDLEIHGLHYEEKQFVDASKPDSAELRLITFDFVITGSQEYHDVTILLYNPTVDVRVPDRQLQFQAAVHNYFTSVPKFEKDTDTVDVHLELIEVLSDV